MNQKFNFKNIIFNISIQKLIIYPFGICPNRNSKWNYSITHQIDYKVYYQISTYNQTVCSVRYKKFKLYIMPLHVGP